MRRDATTHDRPDRRGHNPDPGRRRLKEKEIAREHHTKDAARLPPDVNETRREDKGSGERRGVQEAVNQGE
jgi:hypothetical protein